MFYIFDKKGEFIATSDFEPNLDDLATRDEHCCESGEAFHVLPKETSLKEARRRRHCTTGTAKTGKFPPKNSPHF